MLVGTPDFFFIKMTAKDVKEINWIPGVTFLRSGAIDDKPLRDGNHPLGRRGLKGGINVTEV